LKKDIHGLNWNGCFLKRSFICAFLWFISLMEFGFGALNGSEVFFLSVQVVYANEKVIITVPL